MLLLAFAAALGPTQLPPVDQCAGDPSFVEFRTGLRQAVARRDVKALLAVTADDVHASLGGHIGKKDFIALWGLAHPNISKVWKELGDALSLGCSLRSGVATAPAFEDQMGGERDPFETLIALPGSVLRKAPSDRSAVLAKLRWNVLTIDRPWDGGSWVSVRLDDGRKGFVRRALARSPIDYRAWFSKRSDRWVMEGFLSGD